MAERENIDITVRLHDALSRPARDAEESVDSLRESTDNLNESLDDNKDASQGAAAATDDLADAASDAADAQAEHGRQVAYTTKELRKQEREAKRSEKGLRALSNAAGGLSTNIRAVVGGGGRGLRGMRGALLGLMVVGLVPFLYAAGGAIAVLGAAAYAAIAALSPLVALLGALPALLAGLGQTFATVKMGFSGIGEAVKLLNDPEADPAQLAAALQKLTPAGREFASTLSELKNQTSGWGDSIQSAMLPGFTKLLKGLGPILPVVEKGLVGTGSAMGALAADVGRFVSGMGPDLTTIMDRNTRMVRNGLSPALLGVLSILRDLMIAAGPVAERFTNWIGEATTRMAALTSEGRKSGALEEFFNRAGDRAAAFFGSLKDLSLALYNIGVESSVLGDAMGTGLGGAIRELREWTESETGKQAIRGFFSDSIGPVMELSRMVLGLVQGLGGLASSPALEPLLKQMRTEVGPAIGEAMSNLNVSGMGSSVLDIFTGLATAISALPIQPLTTLVGLIGDLVLGFGDLLKNNPAIATVAATLLTLWVAGRTAAVGFMLVSKGAAALSTGMAVASAGATAAKWAFTGTHGPLKKMTAAQKVAAITGRALGIALRFMLGPIGLLITGIALAIGFFVLLYKRNEAFRSLVDRVAAAVVSFGKQAWEVIKRVASVVGEFLVGAFSTLWSVASGVFQRIWGVVRTVLGWIIGYFKLLFTVYKTIFEIIAGVALIVWGKIKAAAAPVFKFLAAYFRFVAGVAVAVWTRVRDGAMAAWDRIKAGAAVLRGVLTAAFQRVRDVVMPIWNRVREGAKVAFDGIMGVAKPVLDRLRDAFRRVGDVVRGVWDGLSNGLSAAMDGIKSTINGVIGGINKAIDGVNKVKIGDDIPHVPTLYTGGTVQAGTTAFVGELGSELFMPRGGGRAQLIGAGGPELRTFAQPGYVVPNPTTDPSLTAPLPAWVQARLAEPATTAPAPAPSSSAPVAVADPATAPPVTIQMVGDASGITMEDVELAVMRAWRRWKREQEERA